MADEAELKDMAKQLNKAIEEGMEDETPHLSVDPKTAKPAVVGNPNALKEKRGTYTLTFAYPPEKISPEDKTHMKLHEKTGYYLAEVKYEDIFIKPLYRARIVALVVQVLADARIIDLDGYTSKQNEEIISSAFLNHTNDLIEIIKMMINVPSEQLDYLLPNQPAHFFLQLFQNEPNLVEESNNFLF